MPEDSPQQPAETVQPATAAVEEFNPYTAVEDALAGIFNSPRVKQPSTEGKNVSPQQSSQTTNDDALAGQGGSSSSINDNPPAPYQAEVEQLKKQLATEQKKFNDLQSDIDRRVNVASRKTEEQLSARIGQMEAMLARALNPQGRGNEQEMYGESPQASGGNLTLADVDRLVAERLAKDERINRTGLVADLAEFRHKHPDSIRYDGLIGPAIERWPQFRNLDGLTQLYEFASDLERMAIAAAEAAKTGAGTGQINPQPQSAPASGGNGGGRMLTQEQANQLAARSYKPEAGVAPANVQRYEVNPANRNMRQEVERLVKSRLG